MELYIIMQMTIQYLLARQILIRLIQVLHQESSTLINWFRINCMQTLENYRPLELGRGPMT